MTAGANAALREELAELRHRSRAELAQRLRDARGFGDDSNNDEFHALQEERLVLQARIASLENTLAHAVVTDPEDAADGVATIGSTVTIEDRATGRTSRYRLVGAHDRRGWDVVSAASPMGQALMGAEPGAELSFELPNGRTRAIRLVDTEITR